jgi:MbtH protein
MSDDDTRQFGVVVNHEEQYAIWPVGRAVPAGWRAEGFSGPKAECLAHVDRVWTDMRPLSLRARTDERTGERTGEGVGERAGTRIDDRIDDRTDAPAGYRAEADRGRLPAG